MLFREFKGINYERLKGRWCDVVISSPTTVLGSIKMSVRCTPVSGFRNRSRILYYYFPVNGPETRIKYQPVEILCSRCPAPVQFGPACLRIYIIKLYESIRKRRGDILHERACGRFWFGKFTVRHRAGAWMEYVL